MYQISQYTYQQAKKIGVTVKPSTVKGKKIDVYKKGEKVASVGAIGYKSYPEFIKEKGVEAANTHRKAYKNRHQKDRSVIGSRGYYADRLLW
jgi:hypothetical protein